jgi:NADPH:quinone reductase-like Zn-dependent oxidoreductase
LFDGPLRDLIEDGSVTPAIDRTYSLDDTADAIGRMHSGAAIGKVIISV